MAEIESAPIETTQTTTTAVTPESSTVTVTTSATPEPQVVEAKKTLPKEVLLAVVLLLVVVIAGVGYYFYSTMYPQKAALVPDQATTQQVLPTATPLSKVGSGWWDGTLPNKYTDPDSGLAFNYPAKHQVLSNLSMDVLSGLYSFIVMPDENVETCKALSEKDNAEFPSDSDFYRACLGGDASENPRLQRYTFSIAQDSAFDTFETDFESMKSIQPPVEYTDSQSRVWEVTYTEIQGTIRLLAQFKSETELPVGLRVDYPFTTKTSDEEVVNALNLVYRTVDSLSN